MISFQNVSKIYESGGRMITALQDVSFKVEEGEFISIVGRSGAGKTTLFKLLLAEEKPSKGEIFFNAQNVHQMKFNALPLFRRKIGVVFQDYKLLSFKTTYENIAYVLEIMGKPEAKIRQDVFNILKIANLAERMQNFPKELSGGEKQRVAIARALIHRPEIILADEPTGNLDPFQTQEIIRLLLRVNEMGTTILLATHNKEIINFLEKRVITLEDGRLIRNEKEGKFIL